MLCMHVHAHVICVHIHACSDFWMYFELFPCSIVTARDLLFQIGKELNFPMAKKKKHATKAKCFFFNLFETESGLTPCTAVFVVYAI